MSFHDPACAKPAHGGLAVLALPCRAKPGHSGRCGVPSAVCAPQLSSSVGFIQKLPILDATRLERGWKLHHIGSRRIDLTGDKESHDSEGEKRY